MAEHLTIGDTELDQDLDPRDLDMHTQIQEVVSSFEGDVTAVKCKLYKIEKGRRRWLYDAMPAELADVQNALKMEYGPGLYENHVYINGTLDQRLKLDIGETLADKYPNRIPKQEDKGLNSGDILNLVREMNANQAEQNRLMMERMETAITKAIPQQPTAPVNPVEIQSSMLNMMLQMKDLLSPNAAPAPNSDPIETVSRVVEMIPAMQALSGEGSGGASMALLAKEFLPKLMDMATLQAKAPPQSVNPMTPDQIAHMSNAHTSAVMAQQPQQPQQPNPQQQPGESKEMALNNFIVNKALGFLLPAAERGFSPVTYAELLIDQATIYGMEQEVINYILAEGSVDHMIQINAAVGNYREWFEQIKQGVSELVTEVSAEDGLTNPDITTINPVHNVNVDTEQQHPSEHTGRGNGDPRNLARDVEPS